MPPAITVASRSSSEGLFSHTQTRADTLSYNTLHHSWAELAEIDTVLATTDEAKEKTNQKQIKALFRITSKSGKVTYHIIYLNGDVRKVRHTPQGRGLGG